VKDMARRSVNQNAPLLGRVDNVPAILLFWASARES
jgi:hypothetical protein